MIARVVYPDKLKEEIQAYVDTHYNGAFKFLEQLPAQLEQGSIGVFQALDNLTAAYSGDEQTDIIPLSAFFDKTGTMLPTSEIEALVIAAKTENDAMVNKYQVRDDLMSRVADVWVEQQGYQKHDTTDGAILMGPNGESLRELSSRANARPEFNHS
jgi:hypothetical protein